MQLIESWLTGNRNFSYGRILYNKYGSDEALKALFAAGETKEAKAKLCEAMEALVKPVEVQPKPIEIEVIKRSAEPADPVELAIDRDWKEHLTHMNLLRGRLDAYGTDNSPKVIAACHELCIAILEEEQYINACWEKLDYYRVHKRLPELPDETFIIPIDPVQLGKFIESTKRNIRRNKQKASNHPDNALYPALIAKYENLLIQINESEAN